MSTDDLVKTLPNLYLAGVCSFGFLHSAEKIFLKRDRKEKIPVLQAHDMGGQFIGVISTDPISVHPIKKSLILAKICILLRLNMERVLRI